MRNKLFALLCVLSILFCENIFAQSYKEHTVAKGETVSSIAASYHITTDELVNANPSLKNYCYVGMKIQIPIKEVVDALSEVRASQEPKEEARPAVEEKKDEKTHTDAVISFNSEGVDNNPAKTEIKNQYDVPSDTERLDFYFAYKNLYGIIPSTNSTDGYTLSFLAGFGRYLDNHLHYEAQLGYCTSSMSVKSSGWSHTYYYNGYLMLPLSFNYDIFLKFRDDFGLIFTPHIGTNISYLCKSTVKYPNSDEVQKLDLPSNRFGITADLGLKFGLGWQTSGCFAVDVGYEFNNNGGHLYLGLSSWLSL